MKMRFIQLVVAGTVCALGAALELHGPGMLAAYAQEEPLRQTPTAVTLPEHWLNTPPLSEDALRGKAIVLYFFEETCPKCKAQWPGMLQLAEKHALDPIVFVAVNSGRPAAAVEQYAREVGLHWPIIVDMDRSFERACDVGEISLNNIHQVSYITAQGEYHRGRWNDMEDTITRALDGAAWKVDPSGIPDDLKPTWRNIEFGNYAQAAPSLNKALASRKTDIQSAAKKLSDAVSTQAAADFAAAQAAAETSKVRAYDRYANIAEQYAGFPVAKQAAAARRELSKNAELRSELLAIKQVEKLGAQLQSSKAQTRERAVTAIEKVIREHPDSEAARVGRRLLEQE